MSERPSPLISAIATVSLAPGSIICRSNGISSGRVAAHPIKAAKKAALGLNIARPHSLRERLHGFPRGNKLLSDITLISDLCERAHDGRIEDLLRFVQFTPARDAGYVDVP